jgi:predicted hydrolase (HD superfamily)
VPCIILHEWVKSESLRRTLLRRGRLAPAFRTGKRRRSGPLGSGWALARHGLRAHPNLERSPTDGHPFVAATWLREHGWSEEVCRAILSHADYAGVARVTPLERTLYAVDELSGFVMAVARVRPSKSIQEVDVAAVKKKMKDKAFARP